MKRIFVLLIAVFGILLLCGCDKEEKTVDTPVDMSNFSLDDLSLGERDQYDRLCYCLDQVCSYDLTERVAFEYAKYFKAGKIDSMDISHAEYLEDVYKDSPQSIDMRYVIVFAENSSVWFLVNENGSIQAVFAYTDYDYELLMGIIE